MYLSPQRNDRRHPEGRGPPAQVPGARGIQQVTESGSLGKVDVKPERRVDFSFVDELEKTDLLTPS